MSHGLSAFALAGNRWKRVRDLEGRRLRPSNARRHRLRPTIPLSQHIMLGFWLADHAGRPVSRICHALHDARLDRRNGPRWSTNMVRAATVIMPGLRPRPVDASEREGGDA